MKDIIFFSKMIRTEMQSIMRDMGAMGLAQKKDDVQCFLDVVSADLDTSFRDSLTY